MITFFTLITDMYTLNPHVLVIFRDGEEPLGFRASGVQEAEGHGGPHSHLQQLLGGQSGQTLPGLHSAQVNLHICLRRVHQI